MTDFAPLGTMDGNDRGAVAEPLSEAAARPIMERTRHAEREREMTAYDKGYRDGDDRRPKAAHADTDATDRQAYEDGYGDGCQLRDDEHLEQIMNASPDGARTIGGYWFA